MLAYINIRNSKLDFEVTDFRLHDQESILEGIQSQNENSNVEYVLHVFGIILTKALIKALPNLDASTVFGISH